MKRLGLVFMSLAMLGGMSACGGGNTSGGVDGGNTLPDGFITTTCAAVEDCSPTACQTAKCNPVTKMCEYREKTCTAESACTVGMCDVNAGGMCVQMPANEKMACTTTAGDPGTCESGNCNATPNCAGSFPPTIYCDPGSSSFKQESNAPSAFGGGQPVVGSYACAPSEAGPELSFEISKESGVGDEDITVSLRLVNPDGTPMADQTVVDLDLIILEDTCTQGSKCMNPADGAAFKGVTAGTSAERLTFKAVDGKSYFAVVDGKDMNQVHDFVLEVEACGRCQPTDTTRLACNTTMPVTINTPAGSGAALVNEWMCGPTATKTTVAGTGKEVPFYFKTPDANARNVTAKITGATNEVKVLEVPMSFWGQCRPAECAASATSVAGNASLTFAADPAGSDFARYWIIVDATAADASFGLEFSCSKACTSDYDLACGGNNDTKLVTGTTVGGKTENTYWGPGAGPAGCDGLTGLTGPEAVVTFTPTILLDTQYDLTLASKVAGKSLSFTILDAGATATPACDPGATCRANTVTATAGYSGTRTTTGNTAPAGMRFTAQKDHTYFVAVDGVDASGAGFDLQIVRAGATGGCAP